MFYCHQDRHHQLLAENSFAIMQQELRFNIANISTSYQLDWDNPTLLDSIKTTVSAVLNYACRSWSGHLTLAPVESLKSLLEIVSEFLQLKVLFWIEAMNLLKCRERCEAMLRETQKWATQFKV